MRMIKIYLRRVAPAVATIALVIGGIALQAPAASATNPNNGYVTVYGTGQGQTFGCQGSAHHYTNLYGYAIASTDTPTNPTGYPYDCYRSSADVYYPYLQVVYSGWGYFNSLSASAYQANPVQSNHKVCTGYSTSSVDCSPAYVLP